MNHAELCQQVFAKELGMIDSPALRDLTVAIYGAFGSDEYWTVPASTTGKHHPKLSLGDGGLVRHVKFAVWWGDQLCRAMLGTADQDGRGLMRDSVLAALICHDLMKMHGDPTLSHLPERQDRHPDEAVAKAAHKLIVGCHGVDLAQAMFDRLLNRQASPEQILVMYGIAAHMGVWTIPAEYQPNNIKDPAARSVAYLVHLADYAASRKADDFILAPFGPTGNSASPGVANAPPSKT